MRNYRRKSQFFDQGAVTSDFFVLQVCQQFTTLSNHLQQTAAGMMIFLVLTQVICQIVDVLRKDSNLDFRGSGIRS